MLKKYSPTILIMTGIIIVLAALLVAVLVFIYNQPAPERGVKQMIEIAALEPDSSKWGLNFPNQYTTFLKTKENATKTTYGGSIAVDKLAEDPMLVALFAGYPFSKGYTDDRGHMWALEDVRASKRINEKTPGTCYSCKSAVNPTLWDQMGMADYDKTPFSELGQHIDQTIGCANCHEAGTMKLVVTNPALKEALEAQGKDWTTFTRQEMRSLVCANCHVEYYFAGEGKYLTFPWAGGTTIEDIEAYYTEIGFTDWTHPDSGAPMIKMQHPEYETYTAGSTHYNAGVSCADCHMPYTRDGAAKFSNHNVQSPLVNPAASCGTCHTDVDYVVGRVNIIQESVHQTMMATETALVDAINAIKAAAAKDGVDMVKLEEARALHRSAQLRWDFIAAENSMGFHNPEEALRTLASATDLARQAQLAAELSAK